MTTRKGCKDMKKGFKELAKNEITLIQVDEADAPKAIEYYNEKGHTYEGVHSIAYFDDGNIHTLKFSKTRLTKACYKPDLSI